jgi:hypothetical protein
MCTIVVSGILACQYIVGWRKIHHSYDIIRREGQRVGRRRGAVTASKAVQAANAAITAAISTVPSFGMFFCIPGLFSTDTLELQLQVSPNQSPMGFRGAGENGD